MTILSLAALVLLATAEAQAGLIFYSNRANFNTATTGRTDITFTAPSPTGFSFHPTPPGFTTGGVNFNIGNALPGDGLNVTGKDFYGTGTYFEDFLVQSVSPMGRVGTDVVITLPSNKTALALDFGSFNGTPFTFTLSTGDTFTETPVTFTHLAFLGFTSTTPFNSITIHANGSESIVIGDLTFGQAIPEPGSITVLGMCMAGIGCLGWWRRRQAKAAG
jgi:hypothetical protein